MAAYQVLSTLISSIPNQYEMQTNLIGLSLSMLALAGVILILKNVTLNDIAAGLAKMTSILAVLGIVQIVFGVASRIGGGNKLSVSFLGLAAGIAAMLAVMKLLTLVSSSMITKGIGNLALIALLIAGIEVMMGLAGRIGGGQKVSNNILKTSFGLLALIGLIKLLDLMSPEAIDRGIINLAKMSGIIVAIELLTAISARLSGGAKVQAILGAVTVTLRF